MDILRFNSFIAQDVLIFFYYLGAVIIPIFLWSIRLYLIQKLPFYKKLDNNIFYIYKHLSIKRKIEIIFLFIFIFLFMELTLRVMFEFMIAYFDIHNYLYQISKNSQI